MALFASTDPVPVTLKHWNPKCNADLERRLRLQFEVPLTDEITAGLPDALRKAAESIGNIEDGFTETASASTFSQTMEFYMLPDNRNPEVVMPGALLIDLVVYRPEPKDGPSSAVFLKFSTTVRAENEAGDQLVCWALRNLHGEVYLRTFDVQGELPLKEAA